MSPAEIILRVGSGVGGWLVFIAHALVVAVVPRADCDPTSDELWLGTGVLAALSAAALVLLGLGLPWRSSLRWLALPAAALAVYAAAFVVPAVLATSIAGRSLCSIAGASTDPAAIAATGLQRAWPVFQVLVLGFGCAQAARFWRTPVEEA